MATLSPFAGFASNLPNLPSLSSPLGKRPLQAPASVFHHSYKGIGPRGSLVWHQNCCQAPSARFMDCTNILPMTTPNLSLPRGTQCEAEVQNTLRSETALGIPTALVIA